MTDTFLTYRSIVSRVFRLSMMIAAKRHATAADTFDGFLEDLGAIVGNAGNIQALNEFLEREPPSPSSPPSEIDTHIIPISEPVRMVIHEQDVLVEKIASPVTAVEPAVAEEEEAEEETVEVETEEAEAVEEEEETVEVETEEANAVEEEEETVEVETEEADAVEEEEETVEVETEEADAVEEEEETVEVETEEAEEEEVEQEQEQEQEQEEGEAVEEEELEQEEEEAEEAEEEAEEAEEEETEEEEGSFEPIKIGKSMYFVDTSTQNVFAFISDEEAGDLVGKLVNGKLVKA